MLRACSVELGSSSTLHVLVRGNIVTYGTETEYERCYGNSNMHIFIFLYTILLFSAYYMCEIKIRIPNNSSPI